MTEVAAASLAMGGVTAQDAHGILHLVTSWANGPNSRAHSYS